MSPHESNPKPEEVERSARVPSGERRGHSETETPVRTAARGALEAAILAEARRVLVEQGYTDLSMRRLANAIGVTPTSIYLHFQSKDALLHALIDEGMEALHAELSRAAASNPDPRTRIASLCRAYLEFGFQKPEFYEVMFMLHPQHMERYPTEMYRRARRNLQLFEDTLRELPRGGGAGDEGADRADVLDVTLTWSTLHGVVALWIARRFDAGLDPLELLDATVRRVTQTLLHPAHPADDGRSVAEAS